ncbi:MAG: RnfABCDGE type electron transport complex subunit D [Tissierellia bacterium]|nr:RnfABCDGE type electron transport complex subunit D [Tissierellia bacterium]
MKDTVSTSSLMRDVIIALIPAMAGSVYFFGLNALILILISIASCVGFEFISQKAFKKSIKISDLSAVVTGILLAMNLPANAPLWMPIFGGFFAMFVIKECFGGIGNNFINPALGARAMLMSSWGTEMTSYIWPDATTGATPLGVLKAGTGTLPSIMDMSVGNIGGVLGETSAILLLIGGIYLIARKVIDWKIPVLYIISTSIMFVLLGVKFDLLPWHLLGGGLILGAFFMATDYVTIPTTDLGKIIFAVGCGIITALIRVKGNMPEGVSYAILIMNVATPLINRYTQRRVFGEVKAK